MTSVVGKQYHGPNTTKKRKKKKQKNLSGTRPNKIPKNPIKRQAEREEQQHQAVREEQQRQAERKEQQRQAEREEQQRQADREEQQRQTERKEQQRQAERDEQQRQADKEKQQRQAELKIAQQQYALDIAQLEAEPQLHAIEAEARHSDTLDISSMNKDSNKAPKASLLLVPKIKVYRAGQRTPLERNTSIKGRGTVVESTIDRHSSSSNSAGMSSSEHKEPDRVSTVAAVGPALQTLQVCHNPPHHRDGLTLSNYIEVTRVVAQTARMLEDPHVNPDTPRGKANLGKWNRTAVLTGPQGVGKSFAALEIIRVSLEPGRCCLLLAPSRALARQLATDLRHHLERRKDGRSVLLYLEENAREASNSNCNCDFLVVGPLSLKFHLPQLCGRTLGVVVIDELPELRQMLATFLEAGARALEDSLIGVAYVLDMAQKVMLISAQMQDNDIQWATDMMTTETRGKQQVLVFDSDHIPRETVTWKVKNGTHLRKLLTGFLDKGQRVACFSETVVMAENLVAWIRSKYQEQKHALSFTAKDSEALQKAGIRSVSDYSKDCDLFVYTSALALGMNLTPEFDVRFMLADVGFTDAKRLAQLAGRPRNCVQPNLYICIGNSGWRRSPGDGLEEMARNKVMLEYPESLVPTIVKGKLERTLPQTSVTNARLACARTAIQESDPVKRWTNFHYWSDASKHGGCAPGYFDEYPTDEVWDKIATIDALRQLWNDQAVNLIKDELVDVLMDNGQKKMATSDGLSMTITNFNTTKSIMPYMVNNTQSIVSAGKALSNDLLFDLYKKNAYTKLDNFLEVMKSEEVNYWTAAGLMFPTDLNGNISSLFGRTTTHITAAILVACGPMLDVHLGAKGSRVEALQEANKLFALQTVTSEQQTKAQAWISKHWVEDVNMLKKWGVVMPSFNTVNWWKFVGGFMRNTFGFGIEKKTHSKGASTTGHKLVANGFWKAHGIDVVQVGLAHRLRTHQKEGQPRHSVDSVPIMYNGRPYGVLAERMRTCFRCPTSRPATECVRQNGTEWLCSTADPSLGVAGQCHRDYHTPIDTGYLDVDSPNDERKDTMIIEEIEDDTQEEQRARLRDDVDKNLASLPATHRQLLNDLGFISGTYEVNADQMEQAWNSAVDVEYLASVKLQHCARSKQKLKTVRRKALKLLHLCNLDLSTKQNYYNGKKLSTYTVITLDNIHL